MADASNSGLIFVSEQFEPQTLEYVVDGLVKLRCTWVFGERAKRLEREEYVERRSVREIEFEKLRGVPIKQRTYVFTLAGGRFTYIPPYSGRYFHKACPIIGDLDKNRVSTGIRDLDEVIGGMMRGGLFLVEVEHGVGIRYLPLLHAIAYNMVNSGRAVIALLSFVPIPKFDSGKEEGEKALLVMHPKETYDETAVAYVREYERLKHDFGEVLEIIDLDALESRFTFRKAIDFLTDAMSRGFSSNVPIMALVKGGMRSLGMASRLASQHIVLKEMDGALLLYGVSPRTGLYCILERPEGIRMIPIF